jgi:hypothetical protein
MEACINHPDRETNFQCTKHNVYMCEECLHCRDPEIHCKHRQSCPIWFMEKRGGKDIDHAPSADKPEVRTQSATEHSIEAPGNSR